jgi:hypothetical protein
VGLATAQYLPSSAANRPDVVDGLPPTCLDVPACEVLYAADGALRSACEAGGVEVSRVTLGGETGCSFRSRSTPAEVASWRAELPPLLARSVSARNACSS